MHPGLRVNDRQHENNRCLLYYITDRTAFPGDELSRRKRLLEKIAEAARANIDYIQLREKGLRTRELESLACEAMTVLLKLRTENGELRTVLLINSRTDVALAVGADGVHLRSDDVSPKEVRTIRKQCGASARARVSSEDLLIGVSCHSPEDVARANAQGATFAVFAPVFEKKDSTGAPPQGLSRLGEACHSEIPVFALGGITVENAQACIDAGAAGIAGIRLFQENDIALTAARLRRTK